MSEEEILNQLDLAFLSFLEYTKRHGEVLTGAKAQLQQMGWSAENAELLVFEFAKSLNIANQTTLKGIPRE